MSLNLNIENLYRNIQSNNNHILFDYLANGMPIDFRFDRPDSVSEKNITLLMASIGAGNDQLFHHLIDQGADIHAICHYGQTALMYAVKSGFSEGIAKLLDKGALVNQADHSGWTALMYGVMYKRFEIVEMLTRVGADVNAKEKYQTTALIHAAQCGYEPIIQSLCRAGADIDCADPEKGYTALHYAVNFGYDNCVIALVNEGCNINLQNNEGKTARDIAVDLQNTAMVNFLDLAATRLQLNKLIIDTGESQPLMPGL